MYKKNIALLLIVITSTLFFTQCERNGIYNTSENKPQSLLSYEVSSWLATPAGITIQEGVTTYWPGSTYDFGTVTMSSSSTRNFTIRNTGDAVLNILSYSMSLADFTTDLATPSINPGNTVNFNITFNPGALGTRGGTITIQSNDANRPFYSINLRGFGVALSTLSPVTIVSNNANTSYAMVGNTITLSFTANVAIQIPTVTIAGNAASVAGGPTAWTATYTMAVGDTEGSVPFVISNLMDLGGTTIANVSATTNGSSVTFDRTAPTLAITSPAAGTYVNGTAVISFNDSELTTPQVSVDNTNWFSATTGITMLSNISQFAGLSEGSFTLYIRDIDGVGNTGTSSINLIKDTTAPTVSFMSTPTINSANASSYIVTGSCSENGQMVIVSVNGTPYVGPPCLGVSFSTGPFDVTGVPDSASVSITASHNDAAGNNNIASATVAKDIIVPTAAISTPSATLINGSGSVNYAITYTGASMVNLLNTNVTLTTTGGANCGVISVAGGTTFTPTVTLSSCTGTGTVAISIDPGLSFDGVGNTDTGAGVSGAFIVDTAAPTGHTVSIDQTVINSSNVNGFSFTFAGAEIGSGYAYTINSSGGGTPATGSGTIATAGDTISPINVTGLGDGTLTLSVILTDTAGNPATAVNDTVAKDATAPSGYSADIPVSFVNILNQTLLSFTISGAEIGTMYNYSISSSGGGTPVTGSGPVTLATQTIIPIDVSGLGDGTLTLNVTLTDTAGNVGTAANDTAAKEVSAPSGYTAVIDQPYINNGNKAALSFTFSGAEIGTTYNYSITSTGGGGPVAGSGGILLSGQTISGIDATTLGDGTLTLSVSLTDLASNTGPVVTDTVDKDAAVPAGYTVSINQTAINNSNVALFSFTFVGAEVGCGYTYTITSTGGGTPATGSGTIVTAGDTISPINVTGLGDGTLNLGVTLTDAAGNVGIGAIDTVQKDVVVPVVAFTTPTGGARVNGGAVISFNDTETNNPEVSIDNATWTSATSGSTTLGSMSMFMGLGEVGFTLYLRDTDAAGNIGTSSISLTKDTAAPTVAITAPTNGSNVNGSAVISFTDSEPNNPEVSVDNITWTSATSGVTILSSISLFMGMGDGPFTLYLRDTDAAGNIGTYSINLTKDATAPTVAITAPSNGATVSGSAVISFTDSEPNNPEVSVDNVTWSSVISGSTTLGSLSMFMGLGEVSFTLYLRDTDAAGNIGTHTISLTKDTTAPTLAITAPSNGATVNGSAVISFSDSEPNNPEVSVDNITWTSATSGSTTLGSLSMFMGLGQVGFTLYLRDTDAAGNIGTGSISLTKDTIDPTVSFTSTPDITLTNQYAYTVSGTCSENGRDVRVNIGGSIDYVTCSSLSFSRTTDISWYSDGMVTMTADHSDAAGNNATEAVSTASKRTQNISVRINSAFYGTGTLFDFGTVNIGSSKSAVVGVYNTGTGTLTITNVYFSNATYFSISGLEPGSIVLNPGEMTTFTVTYTPLFVGGDSTQLYVDSDDPDTDLYDITLTGTGAAAATPDISMRINSASYESGSSFNFGTVYNGNSKKAMVDVYNNGTANLILTGTTPVTLTGGNMTDFSLRDLGPGPITIIPGSMISFAVNFTPTADGLRSTSLNVASNDPDKPMYVITLNGTGSSAQVPDIGMKINNLPQSCYSTFEFGTVETLTTKSATVEIINNGTADLNLINTVPVQTSGINFPDFNLIGAPGEITIPVGTSYTFTMDFMPAVDGIRIAQLKVYSDDPDTGTYVVNLRGYGDPAAVGDISIVINSEEYASTSSFIFDPVLVGDTISTTVEVHNYGTADLTLLTTSPVGITGSADFTHTLGTGPFTITAGNTQTFDVAFSPTSEGLHFAQLKVVSDDPDTGSYTINLRGIAVMPMAVICGGGTSDTAIYDPLANTFAPGNPTSVSVATGGNSFQILAGVDAGKHAVVHGNNTPTWSLYNPTNQTFPGGISFSNVVNQGSNSFHITAGTYINNTVLLCGNGTVTKRFFPSSSNFVTYTPISTAVGAGSFNFPIPSGGGKVLIISGGTSSTTTVFDPAGSGSFSSGPTLTTIASGGAHGFYINSGTNAGKVMVIVGGGSKTVNLYDPSGAGSFNNFSGHLLTAPAVNGASSVPIIIGPNSGKTLIIHGSSTTLFDPLNDSVPFTPGPPLSGSAGAGSFSFVVKHGPNAGLIVVVHGGGSPNTTIIDPSLTSNPGPNLPNSGWQYTAGDGAHCFPAR